MNQDAFPDGPVDIVVPDLGAGSAAVHFVTWLVPVMSKVIPGERIAEIASQGVVVSLEAEVEGVLIEQIAVPRVPIRIGDVLGRIRPQET